MEIQDRNSLLQILTPAKDGKPQISSVENNVFADILNFAKNETSFPQNDSKGIELKQSVRQVEVSKNVKDKVLDKKDKTSKKTEVEDKDVSNVKKEEDKQVSKKDTKEDTAVSQDNSADSKSEVVKEDKSATETVSEDKNGDEAVESEVVDTEDQFAVAPVTVALQSIDDVVVTKDVSSEKVVLFEQNAPVSASVEELYVEEMSTTKQEADVKASQTAVEEFSILSEEEKLLMEQAKYFDEKVASDKKLKVDVSVSEAKIAEPVVKDVLKNRFEIDSMFQSVDENVDVLASDIENVVDKISLDDKSNNTLVETKNVIFSEAKIVQDTARSSLSKDATVMAVSGKEAVTEVVNTSRNEAFAKINETANRDAFKGMAKEVVEQIKVNITKSAVKGVDTIDIQLKPEDLGKVQIKMHIAKDGKVQAEIIASRAETADLLQKDASSLSRAFNEAGYDTDVKSFTFSFQNENQAKGQEKDDAELLKFIGDTLEQEAESFAGNDNLEYDPVLGLNIRV